MQDSTPKGEPFGKERGEEAAKGKVGEGHPPTREVASEGNLFSVAYSLQHYLSRMNHGHWTFLLSWKGFCDYPEWEGIPEAEIKRLMFSCNPLPTSQKGLAWFFLADQILRYVSLKWATCWNNVRGEVDLLKRIHIGTFVHHIGEEGIQFKFASFSSPEAYRSAVASYLPHQLSHFNRLRMAMVDERFTLFSVFPTPFHLLLKVGIQKSVREKPGYTLSEKDLPSAMVEHIYEELQERGVHPLGPKRLLVWLNKLRSLYPMVSSASSSLPEFLRKAYLERGSRSDEEYRSYLWKVALQHFPEDNSS